MSTQFEVNHPNDNALNAWVNRQRFDNQDEAETYAASLSMKDGVEVTVTEFLNGDAIQTDRIAPAIEITTLAQQFIAEFPGQQIDSEWVETAYSEAFDCKHLVDFADFAAALAADVSA